MNSYKSYDKLLMEKKKNDMSTKLWKVYKHNFPIF